MYKRIYKSPCHGPISQKMMSYYRWPGVWQQLNRNFHHNSLQALDWVQRKTKHCNTELAAYHSRPQFWRQCTHKSTHFSFVWCLTTIFNLTSTDEKFFFYFPKLAGFTKRLTAIYWFLLYSLRFWFFFLPSAAAAQWQHRVHVDVPHLSTGIQWFHYMALYKTGKVENKLTTKPLCMCECACETLVDP